MARDTQYILYKTARTDPTFQNIWAFESREQRLNWLNSCSPYPILNNKYWRVGNTIKIPVRYEESFNYDYVEIRNRVFDPDKTQTWLCFVTARAYISNNCTLLTLAVDYVQTFYFNTAVDGGEYPFWQVNGFISKATNKMLPPRGTASEFPTPEVDCCTLYFNATGYSVVIYSSIDIRDLSSLKYTSAIIDGQYTAAPPYVMVANVAAIAELINNINTAGYTDAIAGIYLIPNDYLNISMLSATPLLATDSALYITINRKIAQPTSCAGYVPVNKELLGYDYSYFTINNGQGEVSTWHFEDFNGTPTFATRLSLASGSPVLLMYPTNYINTDKNEYRQLAVKVTQPPACSFLNDSYKIWLAQTQNSRAAAVNGAQLAISQAKEARERSFTYQAGSYMNDLLQGPLRPDAIYALDSASSGIRNLISNLLGEGFGGGASRGGGAGRSFGQTPGAGLGDRARAFGGGSSRGGGAGIDLNTGIKSYGTYSPSLSDFDSQFGGSLYDLGSKYLMQHLGLENYYVYDHNVAKAQQNLDILLAGYRDKARVPGTAVGSNAYGDACVLGQYGFMIGVYTPTAFYAEWIDKQLSASGHTVNAYALVNRVHAVFDYFAVPSPYIPAERNGRPQYARNMLVSLMAQGVYLWYVHNGDISDRIGVPYGLNNPEIS